MQTEKMVNDLGYVDIKFSVSKKDYSKIEQKNSICINVFCYENDLVYPLYISDKKFKTLREKCPNTEFFLIRICLYSH